MLREIGLLAAILLSAVDVQTAADPPFQVIVHRSNPVHTLTRAEVSRIFMRQVRSWPDGAEIIPLDRRTGLPLREEFSRRIHGKGVAFITRYWHRLIFSGRAIPPAELESDEEVIAFVERHPGAIGYIAAGAPRRNAKWIAVTN